MTTPTDWPTGGFDAPFNEAFQPYLGPPNVWTAEIGGNALECSIVKESLTIRMGKDDPDPKGQADTGTCSFEVIGDPVRRTGVTQGMAVDGGQVTDSGLGLAYRDTNRAAWNGPNVGLAGKTFTARLWYDMARLPSRATRVSVANLGNLRLGTGAPGWSGPLLGNFWDNGVTRSASNDAGLDSSVDNITGQARFMATFPQKPIGGKTFTLTGVWAAPASAWPFQVELPAGSPRLANLTPLSGVQYRWRVRVLNGGTTVQNVTGQWGTGSMQALTVTQQEPLPASAMVEVSIDALAPGNAGNSNIAGVTLGDIPQFSFRTASDDPNGTPFEVKVEVAAYEGLPSTGTIVQRADSGWLPSASTWAAPIEFPTTDRTWVQVSVSQRALLGASAAVYQGFRGIRVDLEQDVFDTFEPGEKVVVKRNGLTVWTGWVSDEQRQWSPSQGSVSKVNAAGPRAQYNQRRYIPTFGNVQGADPSVAAFPRALTNDGVVENWPLSDAVNELAPYFTMGVDQYLTDAGLRLGTMMIYPGTDLIPVMDLLDGAANVTLGQVWEKRDGRLAVYNHAYYRYEGPAEWYANDTVVLNCDDVTAPVEVRREATYVSAWTAQCRWQVVGTPVGDNSSPPEPITHEYYQAPPNAGAEREYSHSPAFPIASGSSQSKWDFMQAVWSRQLEQVDSWTVDRRLVSDELWTRLLTMWMGWPVRITNIPLGLFRDGRTEFNGFLWGWQMTGTEQITLTLVDKALFK